MDRGFNEDVVMYGYLHDSNTSKNTFNKLSQEQKDKYFMYLSFMDINGYLKNKDDDFILNYIKTYNHLLDRVSSLCFFELIEAIKDKMSILSIIEYIPKNMINSYRFKNLLYTSFEKDEDKMKFIDKIIEKRLVTDISYLLGCLEDKNKIKYMNLLSNYSKILLIKGIKDLELKKEYVLKPEYSGFRAELIASVEDEAFILEMFDKITSQKFRYSLIQKIESKELKDKLLKKLGYKTLNDFLDSFDEKEETIKLDGSIDPKIKIGVELETCHKDIEILKVLRDIPHGFKIHKDASVKSGFEVVSPILHYTTEDMSNLNYICKVLKENNFYTDKSCGGHIHIGADYLETVDEYKMLLHLYCNFEDIIYLICNKSNSMGRPSINKYASKTKRQYNKAVNKGVFNQDYPCTYDFTQKLIELNDSRYKGLNVYNLKKGGKQTIEFRMANGEIDFEELIHNIKLYARLIQISKELAHPQTTYKTEYLKLLNQPMRDIDRLNILLNLLFTSEKDKEFYKNRYKKNLKSLKNIISNIIPTINYTQIVNPVALVLKK